MLYFIDPKSIGSLFRVGTEYDRRELCVKEKDVPYVVAGSARDSVRKKQSPGPCRTITSRARRQIQKEGFRADGGAEEEAWSKPPCRLVQHSQWPGGRLGKVLLQGGQLGEEGLEGSGLNGRKMRLGDDTYITPRVYA